MIDKKTDLSDNDKLFLKALSGKETSRKPIWFMRQAGRYLPEYMKIRSNVSNFLELCYSPELASEVTIQPIDRFGFDAAIIFSDILVIPDAMGVDVKFQKGEGPVLSVTQNQKDLAKLSFDEKKLKAVYEAIKLTRERLSSQKALIGFAGAPWTIATYMIEGGSSRDFTKIKSLSYSDYNFVKKLIDILADSISVHLINQIKAGADALQIFDSWASVLSGELFNDFIIEPTKKIVENVKAEFSNIPIIGFPRGVGVLYKDYAEKTGVDAISFDQNMPYEWIKNNIKIPVQGNLDPVMLMSNKEKSLQYSREILSSFADRNFIFNLGHGILPETPIENVEAVVNLVKNA